MRLQGIDTIEQANSWLHEYLREHNQRFARAAAQPEDMHRPWGGTGQALARICSLHHQRQLSSQGACKFEGHILQLQPSQEHAPKARAMIDIAQHEDGTLELSYCGQVLEHRSFSGWQSPPARKTEDDKTLNLRVDKVLDAHRAKLNRLKAEIAFQDSQRQQGIFKPDTPPIVPPQTGAARYGPRPSPSFATSS